ncbi:conserved hypothetical protein [Actinacidiphila cocklensis]|uniref:Uncharacterized protein n=1 Tax=Actinacidiphila cocklensis TaxID=887465 RepID=A0A9W4DS08_9ACTN|nr:conserved hypothetical protein [Actinacidiphila cocklensis]
MVTTKTGGAGRPGVSGTAGTTGVAGRARRATEVAGARRTRAAGLRGAAPGGPRTLTLNRAREELGLEFPDFELAVQLGEIVTVGGGTDRPRVTEEEIARLRDTGGGTQALLARIRLVNTTEGAEFLGISRDRLLRLTRAGCVRPVRWYVNRYRALVWLYLACELRDFAADSPALLAGRLPAAVRESADGEDCRPRGWRSRRVAQLARDAWDPWEEAAVWAALLGPEMTESAVPDPYERSRLRGIHQVLPPGRPGPLADAALIGRLATADHPDEIALGLVALADALGRARDRDPVPRPASAAPAAPPVRAAQSGPVPAPVDPPAHVSTSGPALWLAEDRPRRSLRRLLRGRRQVTDG